MSDSFPSTGVLSLKNPPATTIAVLSVPRRLLQPIYQKCVIKMTEVQCDFVIRLHHDDVSHHVYSSPMPVFGSLKMDADGQSCQIETDETGWNGSSDVHFCLCLKTRALLNSSPGCKFFSLNLWGSARKLFRNEYGTDVEIFRADLFDESKLRLVSSISGHSDTKLSQHFIPNTLPHLRPMVPQPIRVPMTRLLRTEGCQ